LESIVPNKLAHSSGCCGHNDGAIWWARIQLTLQTALPSCGFDGDEQCYTRHCISRTSNIL